MPVAIAAGANRAIRPFDLKEVIGACFLGMKMRNKGIQANKFPLSPPPPIEYTFDCHYNKRSFSR
jgi:hypothetical protein